MKLFKIILNNLNVYFFLLCFAIALFTIYGWLALDPDFGWHYKMGEIIVKEGIPETDPFTYTMPSYPFVDYEWLSNVLIYELYSRYGKELLALLYALIAISAAYIVVPSKYKYSVFFFFLLGSILLPRSGIRPQVEGWLLFAILIRILFNKAVWEKWKWLFPLLMLVWVNLHGSYPIAFVTIGLVKFGEFFQTRKISLSDIAVVLLGFIATLINPYGIRDWQEVLFQMSQVGLFRKTISEWKPFYMRLELGFLLLAVMGLLNIWKNRFQLHLGWVITFLWTLWMAISSTRHLPFFAFIAIPFIASALDNFRKDVTAIHMGKERFHSIMMLFSIIAGIVFFTEIFFSLRNIINETNFYPVKAVEYIKENDLNGRIFNQYGWGGYLIWKLPEHKVFVDGRMTGFLWTAPNGESNSAFRDYLTVTAENEGWEDILKKFDVEYVLWYANEKNYNSPLSIYSKVLLQKLKIESYEPDTPLVERLKQKGWIEIYKDNIAIIIKSPDKDW